MDLFKALNHHSGERRRCLGSTHTCTLFLTSCRCCSSICCFSVTTAAVGCVACPPCCRGDKEVIRTGPQPRDAPLTARGGFAGRVFTPSLTKASVASCLLAALAPGLRSKAHGAGHTPCKGPEERWMHKANSHPRQRTPRLHPGGKQLLPGEQKLSASAAGPSLSTKQLSLPKEASGKLETGASHSTKYLHSAAGWAAGERLQDTPATYLGCGGSRLEEPRLFPQAASHNAGYFHRLLQVSAL